MMLHLEMWLPFFSGKLVSVNHNKKCHRKADFTYWYSVMTAFCALAVVIVLFYPFISRFMEDWEKNVNRTIARALNRVNVQLMNTRHGPSYQQQNDFV